MRALRAEDVADRFGTTGAVLTAVGIVLSGPIGLMAVTLTHPAAPWTSAELYAQQFHWMQTLPFYAGFVLLAGCVMVMAALFAVSNDEQRPRASAAFVATAAFTGLIVFNYICQTTFVPALLSEYEPAFAPAISTLSLQNPKSLAWAIEMWGYGLFGVATWLMAPVLDRTPIERAASRLMIANGVMSLVGGFITTIKLDWVTTTAGMVSYGLWNVLMLALSALLLATFRGRVGALEGCHLERAQRVEESQASR